MCQQFASTVLAVARSRPADAVALFTPGVGLLARAVYDACARDERYAVLPPRDFIPVVALLMPRDFVDALRDWAVEKKLSPAMRSDDGNVGRFCLETGWRVLATVPSLVDHPDDVESLVRNPHFAGLNPARVAACWTGPDWSPLALDWS